MDAQILRRHPTIEKRRERRPSHAQETLGECANLSFYKVEWLKNIDTGERSDPWLIWAPPGHHEARNDMVEEAEAFKDRICEQREIAPDFLLQTGEEEIFRPYRYYGNPEERKFKLIGAVEELMREERSVNESIPASEAERLRRIRKRNFRPKLDDHLGKLQTRVLEPLRRTLIASLLEEYRDLIGLENWQRFDVSPRTEWVRTARSARCLMEGVVRGRSLDTILDIAQTGKIPTGRVCPPIFKRIPQVIISGFKVALRVYVKNDVSFLVHRSPNKRVKASKTDSYSRDEILERAENVYFKWVAAQMMHESSVEGKQIKEVISEKNPGVNSIGIRSSKKEKSKKETSKDDSNREENKKNEKYSVEVEELISKIDLLPDKEEISKKEVRYLEELSNIIPNYRLSKGVEEALTKISDLYACKEGYDGINFKKEYEHKSKVYEDVFKFREIKEIESDIGGAIRRSLEERGIKERVLPEGVDNLVNLAIVYDHIHGNKWNKY